MTLFAPAATGLRRAAQALLLGTVLTAGFAGAASAETLTVTDITVPRGPGTLTVPIVEVVDGNIDEATIRALFGSGALEAAKSFATLNATSLRIPEFKTVTAMPMETGPAVESTVVYRDIELTDIHDGVAAKVTIGSAEVSAGKLYSMQMGRFTVDKFSIGGLLGFYGLTETAAGSDLVPIYGAFHIEPSTLTAENGPTCTIGAFDGGGFNARPMSVSIFDIAKDVAAVESNKTASDSTPSLDPAVLDRVVRYYAEMFRAFTSEPMVFHGLDCSGKDASGTPIDFSFGDVNVAGFDPGIYPAISLADLDVALPDNGYLRLGNFTFKKWDVNGPIAAILGTREPLTEAWFSANWRKLIPAFDGLGATGVTFDVPAFDAGGTRNSGSFDTFDVALDNYINGIPATIALTVDGGVVPLPPELANGPAAASLSARGITAIHSDTHVKLHWDEATKTIVIDELLLDSPQFFHVAISGKIGNATPDLFSENDSMALVAAQGLNVQQVTLDLEDRGFYDLMLQMTAAESGQPLAASRTALAGMAQGMTLAVLGSDPGALAAVGEMGKFLSGQNSKLTLTITAKEGAGISLAEFAELETNPAALAGRVVITATASGDPVVLPVADSPAPPADRANSTQQEKLGLKAPPSAQ